MAGTLHLLPGMRALWLSVIVLVLTATSGHATPPDGATLYGVHCERCHGVTGRGDGPDAPVFTTPPRNLRDGVLGRYSTEDLARRVRTGAPLELALDLPALKARAGDVEALAAHVRRLPTVEWRRAELGQLVYIDRCELCHGPEGKPDPTAPRIGRPPRDLSDPSFQRDTTDQQLARAAVHGRRGMPALEPPVLKAEVAPLVAFLRLLSPGFVLYERYCAACHGDDGRGTSDVGSELRRPSVVFDAAYFRRRDPEQLRAAIWHMLAEERPAMPHLRARLTDAEARAIIDWLKATE